MKKVIKWIPLVISPVLAIVSFILTYFLDPLKYSSQSSLAAIPAFLLSIIILIIGQTISTHTEVEKVSADSERVYESVKNYLHITKTGTPKSAWQYIINRLPVLEYVQNTSFNFEEESEQTQERLYNLFCKKYYWAPPQILQLYSEVKMIEFKTHIDGFINYCRYHKKLSDKTISAYCIWDSLLNISVNQLSSLKSTFWESFINGGDKDVKLT